jgi:hypothetical protein
MKDLNPQIPKSGKKRLSKKSNIFYNCEKGTNKGKFPQSSVKKMEK